MQFKIKASVIIEASLTYSNSLQGIGCYKVHPYWLLNSRYCIYVLSIVSLRPCKDLLLASAEWEMALVISSLIAFLHSSIMSTLSSALVVFSVHSDEKKSKRKQSLLIGIKLCTHIFHKTYINSQCVKKSCMLYKNTSSFIFLILNVFQTLVSIRSFFIV